MISIKDFIYSFVKRCLSLADLRLLWARIMDKYTPHDCVRMFVETMNKKSQQWNLKSSFWIDPSGLGIEGRYSQTTAFDIAMLGFYALSYPKLREIWNNGSMRLMKIQKPYLFHPHKRTLRRIGSNIESGLLAGRYPIIGGKTGAGGGGYTLLIVSKLDKIFGGVYYRLCFERSLSRGSF